MKRVSELLIVNGVKFPPPSPDMTIIRTRNVDAGRNVNGEVIGQLVGRPLWKLNNLKWRGLDVETWNRMTDAIEDFYIPVTFTDYNNVRHTLTMYPSDITAKPMFAKDGKYTRYEECSFNLIDAGWNE